MLSSTKLLRQYITPTPNYPSPPKSTVRYSNIYNTLTQYEVSPKAIRVTTFGKLFWCLFFTIRKDSQSGSCNAVQRGNMEAVIIFILQYLKLISSHHRWTKITCNFLICQAWRLHQHVPTVLVLLWRLTIMGSTMHLLKVAEPHGLTVISVG